jgi:hypothetical protein
MNLRICLLTSLLLTPLAVAGADTLRLESPGPRVSLLELYTSEGCSSCPPADRWISKLREDPRLWREVVPVAFHVDYWDYIGWPDRFASPAFGARQREYARTRRVSTVYTPGFVLAGEEWRTWFFRPVLKVDSAEQAGKLTLDLDGREARMSFAPSTPIAGSLDVHVAVLGFGLKTEVRAGENGGRTLEHDFVVLGYRTLPATRSEALYTAEFTLPPVNAESERQAVAAWLSARNDPGPVQVVGGWLGPAKTP